MSYLLSAIVLAEIVVALLMWIRETRRSR